MVVLVEVVNAQHSELLGSPQVVVDQVVAVAPSDSEEGVEALELATLQEELQAVEEEQGWVHCPLYRQFVGSALVVPLVAGEAECVGHPY